MSVYNELYTRAIADGHGEWQQRIYCKMPRTVYGKLDLLWLGKDGYMHARFAVAADEIVWPPGTDDETIIAHICLIAP